MLVTLRIKGYQLFMVLDGRMTSFHNNMCNVSNIFMHANVHRAMRSLNYYAGKNIGGKHFQETERSGRDLNSTDKAKSFFVWKVFRSCNRSVPIAPNKWNFRKTTNVSLISPFQTKLKEAHPKPPSSFCLSAHELLGSRYSKFKFTTRWNKHLQLLPLGTFHFYLFF